MLLITHVGFILHNSPLISNFGFTDAERKDTTLLAHRSRLTTALAKGDVTEAIQLLQQLDSQLLSANPHLMYYVEKQGLLELIRQGNTVEALQFAQTRVAPLAKQNVCIDPIFVTTNC